MFVQYTAAVTKPVHECTRESVVLPCREHNMLSRVHHDLPLLGIVGGARCRCHDRVHVVYLYLPSASTTRIVSLAAPFHRQIFVSRVSEVESEPDFYTGPAPSLSPYSRFTRKGL